MRRIDEGFRVKTISSDLQSIKSRPPLFTSHDRGLIPSTLPELEVGVGRRGKELYRLDMLIIGHDETPLIPSLAPQLHPTGVALDCGAEMCLSALSCGTSDKVGLMGRFAMKHCHACAERHGTDESMHPCLVQPPHLVTQFQPPLAFQVRHRFGIC